MTQEQRTVIINGRRVAVPSVAKVEDIRQAGNIAAGRTIVQRKREGNFIVRPGQDVAVQDGDVFIDAPPRIKG